MNKRSLFFLIMFAGMVAVAGCAEKPAAKPAATPAPTAAPAPAPTAAPAASADEGKKLFSAKGCMGCHGASGEGIPGVGPALAGLPGSEVALADGKTVTADDAFIIESITSPGATIVKGYPVAMPNLGVSDSDAKAILAYLKTL